MKDTARTRPPIAELAASVSACVLKSCVNGATATKDKKQSRKRPDPLTTHQEGVSDEIQLGRIGFLLLALCHICLIIPLIRQIWHTQLEKNMSQLQTSTQTTVQAPSRLIVWPDLDQERSTIELPQEVEAFLRMIAEMVVESLSKL